MVRTAGKEQCRTPDSPEGARVVAPRSPISPQISQHHSTLVPPRSASSQVNRHGSSSPTGTVNGSGGSLGSLTPPPAITPASAAAVAAAAAAAAAQQDTAKLLKIRRFLGALVQFGQDANVDTGDRVRALVLSLASGAITVDEFQLAVQEATNFPLRTNVVPFLKSHVPVLQREINILARSNKQLPCSDGMFHCHHPNSRRTETQCSAMMIDDGVGKQTRATNLRPATLHGAVEGMVEMVEILKE
uniref:TAFH domain-containing protein n=1 Tax=Anopheles culicifacies TaxID=139723 RepID=A0A182MEE2_9DIPT